MGDSRGIRWPDDLAAAIEEAMIEDKRRKFSDEVFFLVELGLEEAKLRRSAVARDIALRRGERLESRESRASGE